MKRDSKKRTGGLPRRRSIPHTDRRQRAIDRVHESEVESEEIARQKPNSEGVERNVTPEEEKRPQKWTERRSSKLKDDVVAKIGSTL